MCNLSLGLIEEGEKKGLQKGLQKGEKKGRAKERADIIVHMLNKGRSPEDVADDTGVPLEEVKAVQERMLVSQPV